MRNKNNDKTNIGSSEDIDELKRAKMVKLNQNFYELCEKNANSNIPLTAFMDRYKGYVDNIEANLVKDTCSKEDEEVFWSDSLFLSDISVDNSIQTNHMGSDTIDEENYQIYQDNDFVYKNKIDKENRSVVNVFREEDELYQPSVGNKTADIFRLNFEDHFDGNYNSQQSEHNCIDSEIYKFLIEFYGVECPMYRKPIIGELYRKKKLEPYKWPFQIAPKKPRSVFDTGPTREEVGEYNRRIFDIVTQKTFKFPRDITYRFNPNFFDDGSEESETNKEHLYKSEVELYKYDGDVYVYYDLVILRLYKKDSSIYLSLRSSDGSVIIDSEFDCFKLIPDERGDKFDVLYLLNLKIYRLLFRSKKQVERILKIIDQYKVINF